MSETVPETAAYTKTELVRELAQHARISRRRVEVVLEQLAAIAYRQARQGFAVPGICRLDVVHRKARQVRNPQTGDILLIAEHDALRVRPVKRAKQAVAPTPRALVQILAADAAAATPAAPAPAVTPAPTATPAPAAAAPAAPSLPSDTVSVRPAPPLPPRSATEEGPFVSFRCQQCSQEIEAPMEMVGNSNECPTCGESLVVPYTSEPGTLWYQERRRAQKGATTEEVTQMKGRTIRIELPDDL